MEFLECRSTPDCRTHRPPIHAHRLGIRVPRSQRIASHLHAPSQTAREDATQSFATAGLVCPDDERGSAVDESYSLVLIGTPGIPFNLTLTTPLAQIQTSEFTQLQLG